MNPSAPKIDVNTAANDADRIGRKHGLVNRQRRNRPDRRISTGRRPRTETTRDVAIAVLVSPSPSVIVAVSVTRLAANRPPPKRRAQRVERIVVADRAVLVERHSAAGVDRNREHKDVADRTAAFDSAAPSDRTTAELVSVSISPDGQPSPPAHS